MATLHTLADYAALRGVPLPRDESDLAARVLMGQRVLEIIGDDVRKGAAVVPFYAAAVSLGRKESQRGA